MKKVRFGDVASRLNIKVDQATTELEYYIGGEHIESSELLIHSKAPIKGSTIGYQFQFGFRKGDILFMTKNPHLRKTSMVDFDGLCSIATFVIHSNDENVLLQDYLLMEMQTDRFWDYCESHKSGGVNYFINWGTLSNYEFSLPTIEEQKSLVDKMWAAYKVKESYRSLIKATDEMVKSRFIEMFGNPVTNTKSWPTKALSEVAPESPSTNKATGLVWVLNLDMVESQSGRVIEKVYDNVENLNSVAPFDDGNVLFSKLRPYLNKVVIPNGKGYATTELVPLRPNTTFVRKEFLACLLRSNDFVNYADAIATGTKMPRMPMTALRDFKCIIPPVDLQDEFLKVSQQADKSKYLN